MKKKKTAFAVIIVAAVLVIGTLYIIFSIKERNETIKRSTQFRMEAYEEVTAAINEEFPNSVEVRTTHYNRCYPYYIFYNFLQPVDSEEEFLVKSFSMYVCGEKCISDVATDHIDEDYNSIGFYCGDYQVEYYKHGDEMLIESDIPDVEKKIAKIRDELKETNPEYSYPIKISKLSSDE